MIGWQPPETVPTLLYWSEQLVHAPLIIGVFAIVCGEQPSVWRNAEERIDRLDVAGLVDVPLSALRDAYEGAIPRAMTAR